MRKVGRPISLRCKGVLQEIWFLPADFSRRPNLFKRPRCRRNPPTFALNLKSCLQPSRCRRNEGAREYFRGGEEIPGCCDRAVEPTYSQLSDQFCQEAES